MQPNEIAQSYDQIAERWSSDSFSRSNGIVQHEHSIWHLPMPAQVPVMTKLFQGLTSGGVCIFTTGGLDAPEEKVDSAMGVPMYYSVLGIPQTLQLIDACGCVCRHLEYDQYPEPHLYLIVQKSQGG